ncbi:cardiotrophin-like cytokine factor 1 [Manacus vitellinus]|uniref:cardiotrophin-like cytokine factor 1 n=1 Tax=Manacus vitellinus TaxID=328815 RepID=UPI00115F4811|nr:cardiotrophin-like cytokine factor 1 [Manacus vitellinus]
MGHGQRDKEIGDMLNYLGPPFNEPDFNPPRLARAERVPSATVAPNDFLKKMDDFWLLKELQTWLWRSAKDFNRLKKKVPPAVVTLRLEARGF